MSTGSGREVKYPKPPQSLLSEIWLPCSFFILLIGVMGAFIHRHLSQETHLQNIPNATIYNDMDFVYKEHKCQLLKTKRHSREFYTKCGGYFSFSKDYNHSRARFRHLSKVNQLQTGSKWIDKDKDLSMDFSLIRGSDPSKLLIYMCGVHGVESRTGSAIFLNLLMQYRNNTFSIKPAPNILFLHSYNPFGFVNHRRVNPNNVDLNRNLLLTKKEWQNVLNRDPNIAGYENVKIISTLAPSSISGSIFEKLQFWYHWLKLCFTEGKAYVLKGLVTGQYHHKQGLFYGGTELQREHKIFYKVLMQNKWNMYDINTLKQVIIVDVHSGLGPPGMDTLMVDTIEEYQMIKDMIPTETYNAENGRLDVGYGSVGDFANDNIWDYSLQKGSTNNWCKLFTKKSNSDIDTNFNQGMLDFYEENVGKIEKNMELIRNFTVDIKCAHITEEFGTVSEIMVFTTLIEENLITHRESSTLQLQRVRKKLLDTFYINKDEWRSNIIANGNNFFDLISKV